MLQNINIASENWPNWKVLRVLLYSGSWATHGHVIGDASPALPKSFLRNLLASVFEQFWQLSGTFSLSLFYFHHSSRSSLLCLLSCVHLAGPVKVSVIESESAIIWAFFTFTTAVAVLCILSTAHRAHCTLCSLPALSRSRSKVNLSPKSIRRCCCLRLPAFAASVTLALPQSRNT